MSQQRLRDKPKFSGAFYSWKQTVVIDRDKGVEEYFLVFSSGKREAVRRYLWLKLLWAELTKEEFHLFLLTLGDREDKKWAMVKLLSSLPRKLLRARLLRLEELLGEKRSSRESYLGSQRIRIELQRGTRKLPKTPKYSGYVRSIASLGKSGSRTLELKLEELYGGEYKEENQINWEEYLSVGRINPYGFWPLPEESQEGRNGT